MSSLLRAKLCHFGMADLTSEKNLDRGNRDLNSVSELKRDLNSREICKEEIRMNNGLHVAGV